jgi:signal transduction histidine kinase
VRRRLLLSHLAVAAVAVAVVAVPVLILKPSAAIYAAVAAVAAAWLAFTLARKLARPVEELAEAAARLGAGDPRPLGRRYGAADLDQLADGLNSSARRLSSLLAADRELATDVSHQLRTPLTALSMRLEEMIAAADDPVVVREEGSAALAQAERLADVVSQLLSPARRAPSAALTGVDDIIEQQVVEWEPAFRRARRRLAVIGVPALQAYVTPGGLAQVIATLLDNALMHGGGTVTIQTSQNERSVVIEVRDEGRGIPPELVSRIFERSVSGRPEGTGLGLALARTMAAADGGRVVLVKARPATFAVFLPRNPPPAVPTQVRGPALPGSRHRVALRTWG